MVISMEAHSDQTMSSPIEQECSTVAPTITGSSVAASPSPTPTAASVTLTTLSQQDSADDEQNDDEQSKGSNQTVVIKQQSAFNQKQQKLFDNPEEADPRAAVARSNDDDNDEARQGSAPMIVSRGSSFEDERKMMHIDDDEDDLNDPNSSLSTKISGANQRQQSSSTISTKRFVPTTRISPQEDSLVARMRDIVEGDQRLKDRPTGHVTTASEPPRQPKSSSDSLNNQNENNSKASVDSGNQNKRTRHSRPHCNKHHHHHHHHHQHHRRQSTSEGASVGGAVNPTAPGEQINPNPHHHHHHHQHRHATGHRQRAHSHHHHHHHHQHSQPQGSSRTSARNSIQRPSIIEIESPDSSRPADDSNGVIKSEKPEEQEQQQKQQNNESKSSTSSISSSTVNKQDQITKCQHNNPDQADLENKSSQIFEEKNQPDHYSHNVRAPQQLPLHQPDEQHRARDAHLHHHHHQHQSGASDQAEQYPHPHHHHHHHHHHQHPHNHHHHHCHHRSHKKRLVLDTANDQSTNTASEQQNVDASLGGDQVEESKSTMTKRGPLQELSSQTNISTCCPYHEHQHQCNEDSKQTKHPHHHHHHHHNHHSHQHHVHLTEQQMKDTTTTGGDQTSVKPHHHHHHHHHRHLRHHHHGHNHAGHHHHNNKQRHKARQKSVSKTNLEQESTSQEQSGRKMSDVKGDLGGSQKIGDSDQTLGQSGPSGTNSTTQLETINGGKNSKKSADVDTINSENRMHLDEEGEEIKVNDEKSTAITLTQATGEANNEVVKMEMSPNSEGKQSRMAEDCEHLIDSTASDSNLITSIEIIPAKATAKLEAQRPSQLETRPQSLATNNRKQSIQQQQPAKDSDSGSQGASGSGQIGNRSSVQGFRTNRDSQKENHTVGGEASGLHDKLIRQTSSNDGSKKSQKGELGSGATGQERGQQLNECSPLQPGSCQQSGQTRQITESTVPLDRRCRLCWCCCCPCSALSNRGSAARVETVKPVSEPSSGSPTGKCPSLPNVNLEEIRAWGESFDRLMKCSDGRKIFQEFLRCEYSEENILFWTACEELKSEREAKNIAAKARDIYEDYISILSSKEVSLDSRVRDIINNNIKKPTSNIFDEAQLQIYTLMHRDSYPRFINSSMYKKLAQIQPSSRKSSS